jgi:hypothetical protein
MYISRALGFAAGALRTQNVASIVSRPLGVQAAVKGKTDAQSRSVSELSLHRRIFCL